MCSVAIMYSIYLIISTMAAHITGLGSRGNFIPELLQQFAAISFFCSQWPNHQTINVEDAEPEQSSVRWHICFLNRSDWSLWHVEEEKKTHTPVAAPSQPWVFSDYWGKATWRLLWCFLQHHMWPTAVRTEMVGAPLCTRTGGVLPQDSQAAGSRSEGSECIPAAESTSGE